MSGKTPQEIIEEAQNAGLEAGKKAFAAIGNKDVGTCGGYILSVDGRTAVAKYLTATGNGIQLGNGVSLRDHPNAPRVQNMDVNIAMGEAAKAVLEKHGVKIAQARSYID